MFLLCYITDRRGLGSRPLLSPASEAVQAGVDLLQVREKDLGTRALIQLCEALVACAKESNTRVTVNDRLDVAIALGAGGVHLGGQSLPPQAVRECVPAGFLVGVSCHSVEEARTAEAAGADYVLFGPIFETPSKKAYGPPLGLLKLKEVTASMKIPVLALGGISVDRVWPCLEAGAAGVAGIRIFQDCPSLPARVQQLRGLAPEK